MGQLCEPLDTLINEFAFATSPDEGNVSKMVCEFKERFDCLFEPSNFPECQKILAMGSDMGTPLPMSQAEFDESCAPFARPSERVVPSTAAPLGCRAAFPALLLVWLALQSA